MPPKARVRSGTILPREESYYRVRCHQCGAWCRTLPDGSDLPSVWFCDCSLPDDPESAYLRCDACIQGHVCPPEAVERWRLIRAAEEEKRQARLKEAAS